MSLTNREFKKRIDAAIEYCDSIIQVDYAGSPLRFYREKLEGLKSKYMRVRMSDDPEKKDVDRLEKEISVLKEVIKKFETI